MSNRELEQKEETEIKEEMEIKEEAGIQTVKAGRRKAAGGKKRKKHVGLIIALAAVVLLIGYTVISGLIAGSTPVQVSTVAASAGTVEETMTTSGTVSGEQSKTYYAPVGTLIARMELRVGDEVKAGQQLVVFDTADLENAARKASLDASATANASRSSQYQSSKNQSEYNEAVVGLEELKELAQQQEQYVQGLKYQLEDETQRRKEELQEWQGKLNQELEIQTNKLSVQQDPQAREGIQEIISNLNAEIRDVSNQIGDLSMSEDLKEKTRLIDSEQKKLEDMREEISRREGKESSSEAGITDPYAKAQQEDSAQSALIAAQDAQSELDRAKEGVTAEFAGIVTRVGAAGAGGLDEGAVVARGTELLTVESSEQVQVEIEVTKYDLARIAVGQKADLTIGGKVYNGTVSSINRVATDNSQGTPVVKARIHIENPDAGIYLGVEARVVIHTGSAKNVVVIPVELINADKQGEFCYVVENGMVVMRRITTGLSSDTMAEVKEGLKEGDQVVYDLTGMITEGMTVTAVPMDAPAEADTETESSGQ